MVIHITNVFLICEKGNKKYFIFHLTLQSFQSFNFKI